MYMTSVPNESLFHRLLSLINKLLIVIGLFIENYTSMYSVGQYTYIKEYLSYLFIIVDNYFKCILEL